MCRVRACGEEKEKKRTVDSKSFHRVFFGYDHAASAAILEKLPGMSILYSAHGRYNDEDFPCRSRVEHETLSLLTTTHNVILRMHGLAPVKGQRDLLCSLLFGCTA